MANSALIKEFEEMLGKDNVFSSEADRRTYAYDAAVLNPVVPAFVVRPTSKELLAKCVTKLYEEGIPMTVRGSGTNLSGGTIPDTSDTVVILTSALNRILEINTNDLYAVVEPGVVTADLAAAVAAKGLFYPPDPGSMSVSSIGGNIMENAGGLRGLKYGVTKDYVMGVEFVDATGATVKSGSRTVKCVTGYNLAGMLVQSEGTLGVLTESIMKLVPPPRASKACLAEFDHIQKAAEAVAGIIAEHILPCTLEFLDNNTICKVDDFTHVGLPRKAAAILLIEVDGGHEAQVADEAEAVLRVLKENGATSITVAKTAEEKDKLWFARRQALPVLARVKPTTVLEDATVPRSQIPAMMKAITEIATKYRLDVGTFGHAGDGNLHPTFLCDKRDKDEFSRVELAIDEMFDTAIKLGGTLSGEHGIGTAKAKWLEKETSRGTILFSRRLRKALDPKGLLNPTKQVSIMGGE
ncbi:MAG: FAD-linked oxidase C-terminal domain-containing protein [Desulfovibrionaceae bacterium]|nr:FAD-linked oxidase C-terminal domain-containing protein [Desulfovibrionaceae bacterium]